MENSGNYYCVSKYSKKFCFNCKVIHVFVMIRLVFLFSVLLSAQSAVIYIDHHTLDWNRQLCNWSTSYTHNEKRNAIVNLTMQIPAPLTKFLVYLKVNLSQNKDDRSFKMEFMRTVFDGEKVASGAKKNFLVAAFVENPKKFMDFEIKFPLQPVSLFFSKMYRL